MIGRSQSEVALCFSQIGSLSDHQDTLLLFKYSTKELALLKSNEIYLQIHLHRVESTLLIFPSRGQTTLSTTASQLHRHHSTMGTTASQPVIHRYYSTMGTTAPRVPLLCHSLRGSWDALLCSQSRRSRHLVIGYG